VDSAVVVFTPHTEPLCEETPIFRALVKGAFGQRRKKLRNAWQNIPGRDQQAVAAAAERAGINLDARGETLSVQAFARMSQELEQ
jgi:16S rRNA (adenine1518-N6/adenine1519-N6)-dimethyltransferase